MLRNKNIVYFANNWDSDNRTSSHQIASLLGIYNRVLYVESGGLRSPTTSAHDLKRIASKIWRFFRGSLRVHSGFKDFRVISLILLPFHRLHSVEKMNEFITLLTIKFYMWLFDFEDSIVFFFFPHLHYLCKKINASHYIYYCIDDYSGLPGVDTNAIRKMDDALTRKANTVFVVCSELLKEKKTKNYNVYYSPHGVDVEHFNTKRNLEMPKQIRHLYGSFKIVIFWGLLAEWLDYELIEKLIQEHHEKHFLFIGRSTCNMEKFYRYNNVTFLGPVPYDVLPCFAKYCDALINPFTVNSWTKTINPIKLKEYLATGKPVVSTALPEAVEMEEFIYVGRTHKEISKLLNHAIQNDTEELETKRLKYISQKTWYRRVEEISMIVLSKLSEQTPKISS